MATHLIINFKELPVRLATHFVKPGQAWCGYVFTQDVVAALQLGIEKPVLWRELDKINPKLVIGIRDDGKFYAIVHPDSISSIQQLVDREMTRAIQDLLTEAFAK